MQLCGSILQAETCQILRMRIQDGAECGNIQYRYWSRLPGKQQCKECVAVLDQGGEEVALDRDKDHHRDLLVNLALQQEDSVV